MHPYHIPPPNKCPLCHRGLNLNSACTCSFDDRNFWTGLDLIKNVDDRMKAVESLYKGRLIDDWQLWDVLSNHNSPFSPKHAAMVYQNLGFVPFAGYPPSKLPEPLPERLAAFDAH